MDILLLVLRALFMEVLFKVLFVEW